MRIALATGLTLAAWAPPALADHHFVAISEVYPGEIGHENADFVELRMYDSLQNNFSPAAKLVFYDSLGDASDPFDLSDVTFGVNQATALWGTDEMESFFMIGADTTSQADVMQNSAGGVCLTSTTFDVNVDCVSWGGVTIPGKSAPAAAIPEGASLNRKLNAGCNTLLEASDDTDWSSLDFFADEPTPEANSGTPSGVSSCPNTEITAKPTKQTTDRTPVFRFAGGDGYRCKIDRDPFESAALRSGLAAWSQAGTRSR